MVSLPSLVGVSSPSGSRHQYGWNLTGASSNVRAKVLQFCEKPSTTLRVGEFRFVSMDPGEFTLLGWRILWVEAGVLFLTVTDRVGCLIVCAGSLDYS